MEKKTSKKKNLKFKTFEIEKKNFFLSRIFKIQCNRPTNLTLCSTM